MKNKKSLYILIPAVLLVWSLIIYKVYSGMGDEDNYYTGDRIITADSVDHVADKFDYELLLTYPDPFLRGQSSRPRYAEVSQSRQISAQPVVAQQRVEPAPVPAQEKVNWQQVRYLGIVEHKKNKSQVVFIEVNNKSYMLKQGEEAEGFLLKKVTKDSVLMMKDKEEAYIRK